MYQTQEGYVVSEENLNSIKEICPELSFNEILRMIDLWKTTPQVFSKKIFNVIDQIEK